jgi:hypothetical protein
MMSKYSKVITKWLFRAYIVWSIIVDITILGGILWFLFR